MLCEWRLQRSLVELRSPLTIDTVTVEGEVVKTSQNAECSRRTGFGADDLGSGCARSLRFLFLAKALQLQMHDRVWEELGTRTSVRLGEGAVAVVRVSLRASR